MNKLEIKTTTEIYNEIVEYWNTRINIPKEKEWISKDSLIKFLTQPILDYETLNYDIYDL